MINYKEKDCQGHCPECDSENINWEGSELFDETVIYSAQCDECKTDFTEEYQIQYNVTISNKEKGNEN